MTYQIVRKDFFCGNGGEALKDYTVVGHNLTAVAAMRMIEWLRQEVPGYTYFIEAVDGDGNTVKVTDPETVKESMVNE